MPRSFDIIVFGIVTGGGLVGGAIVCGVATAGSSTALIDEGNTAFRSPRAAILAWSGCRASVPV